MNNQKIKCILVDDEPPALLLLSKHAEHIEQLEIVATSHNVIEAGKILKEQAIDLMFLDIQMPLLNGIDFLKTLKTPPAVIITTGYREYALEGYDLDIIDYLLKPISFERFYKAVQRYEERSTIPKQKENPANDIPKHIFVNVNRVNHKIVLDDIIYLESLKDYVRIHLNDHKLVVKGNLGTTMKLLPETEFIRVHRSFAVPLSRIQSYSQTELHIGDIQIPIGHSFRKLLMDRLR